jgi:hypothetical protein
MDSNVETVASTIRYPDRPGAGGREESCTETIERTRNSIPLEDRRDPTLKIAAEGQNPSAANKGRKTPPIYLTNPRVEIRDYTYS